MSIRLTPPTGSLEVSNVVGMFSPLITVVYINKTNLGWRACYWHMFACEGAAVISLFFWYKPPSFETKHRADGKSRLSLMKELDYVGVFLFTVGSVLILMALNWVGLHRGSLVQKTDHENREEGYIHGRVQQ
jgi:hypothetical protein